MYYTFIKASCAFQKQTSVMIRLVIFASLSILIIAVSWRTIFNIKSHGFYRFLSWECIAWLVAGNYKYWFDAPLSLNQIVSWILLIISGYLVIHGAVLLVKKGKPKRTRNKKNLYPIEETTQLIDNGIFKYIRHPLYSSLLFLTWGIFFKHVTFPLLFTALLSTLFLYLTAVSEEKECIDAFGDQYRLYMKHTRMFIPYIF